MRAREFHFARSYREIFSKALMRALNAQIWRFYKISSKQCTVRIRLLLSGRLPKLGSPLFIAMRDKLNCIFARPSMLQAR